MQKSLQFALAVACQGGAFFVIWPANAERLRASGDRKDLRCAFGTQSSQTSAFLISESTCLEALFPEAAAYIVGSLASSLGLRVLEVVFK